MNGDLPEPNTSRAPEPADGSTPTVGAAPVSARWVSLHHKNEISPVTLQEWDEAASADIAEALLAADQTAEPADTLGAVEEEEEEEHGPSAADLRRHGRFLLDMGRPVEALQVLQRLVDWYPDDSLGWCEVAQAFFALYDHDRMLRAADLAIEADPYGAEGYLWKCRLQAHKVQWTEALETVDQGLEMTYGEETLQQWRVRLLLGADRKPDAASYLLEKGGTSQDAEWAFLRGEAALLAEDIPGADAAFRQAYATDANHADALAGIAAVLTHQKRVPEAVHCMHRAVQLAPSTPELGPRAVGVVDALVKANVPAWSRFGLTMMVVSVFCTPGVGTLVLFPAGLIAFLAARAQEKQKRREVLAGLPEELRAYYNHCKEYAERERRSNNGIIAGCLLIPLVVVAVLVGLFTALGWVGALQLLLVGSLLTTMLLVTLQDARPPKQALAPFRFPGDPYVPAEDEDLDEDEDEADVRRVLEEWQPSFLWLSRQLMMEGKLEPARDRARDAVKAEPEDAEALAQLSLTSLLVGDLETSLQAAKSGRTHEVDETFAHALVWINLAVAGRMEEAVAEAEAEPGMKDDARRGLMWVFRLLIQQKPQERARSLSTLIQRLYPGSAEPHEVEGEWAVESGKATPAIEAFRRGLAIEPDSPSLHANLAVALAMRYRLREASAAARRALALDPDQPSARQVLERSINIVVLGMPLILTLLIALGVAAPTVMGAATNPAMTLLTLFLPLAVGAITMLLVRPVVRLLAPGLAMEMDAEDGFGSFSPQMNGFFAWSGALLICATVQSLQAWLEILLHRNLFPVRWPGAVTATSLAVFGWWVIYRLYRSFRE